MYEKYAVLFVDDEENILKALKRGLLDEKYAKYTALSGKEALEIMEKEKIAVIVSDMRMPEMDGLYLLKEVKKRWPKTVRIVLSGYTQLQQILTTINQVDIFKFITKPWRLDADIKYVIHQALDFYILQEENEKNKEVLQKQNQAYQNILKSVEAKIAKIKNSNAMLGICGKAIMAYNRESGFAFMERLNYFQEKLYALFMEAAVSEEKDCAVGQLMEECLQIIKEYKIKFRIEHNLQLNTQLKLVPMVLQATLKSCLYVLYEELKNGSLIIQFSMVSKNNLLIYFILNDFESIREQKNKDSLNFFQIKIGFLEFLLSEVLTCSNMSFKLTENKDNILAMVNIKSG